MSRFNIKSYIFEKLFFPKVFTIDTPGCIFSRTVQRYKSEYSQIRIVYCFEDIISDLQKNTIDQIGFSKTDELFFRVGKISAMRLIKKSGSNIPNFLVDAILPIIINNFHSAGFTVCDNIEFDKKKKYLCVYGEDNLICRKSGCMGLFRGAMSGVMTCLFDENINVRTASCSKDSNICRLETSDSPCFIPSSLKYPEFEKIHTVKCKSSEKLHTLSDMIRFKKIDFDDKGRMILFGQYIIPWNFEIISLMENEFRELGQINTFQSSVKESAKNISDNLTKSFDEYIKILKNIYSAMGLGILVVDGQKSPKIRLLNPPCTESGYIFYTYLTYGFMNHCLDYSLKEYNYDAYNRRLFMQLSS